MADKRVGVRLSASGGDKVRAELEGVGRAGKEGLGKVSAEADRARARLAAFARRAALASAAAIAALTAVGVASVRRGLATIDQQAKLAESLDTTVESMQILARAGDLAGVSLGEIQQATFQLTRRLSKAASDAGPAADALDRLGLSAETLAGLPLDERLRAIFGAVQAMVPEVERAGVLSDLFGDRASVAFSRVAGTIETATSDVRDFGVAVSESGADAVERANDSLSRLRLILTGATNQLTVAVAPSIEQLAEALAGVARDGVGVVGVMTLLIDTGTALVENLDAVGAAAGTFAAFMAGRWVINMGLAAAATIKAAGGIRALSVILGATPFGRIATLAGLAVGALVSFRDTADGTTPAATTLSEATRLLAQRQAIYSGTLNQYATRTGPDTRRELIASTQEMVKLATATVTATEAERERLSVRLDAVNFFPDAENINPTSPRLAAELTALDQRLVQSRTELTNLRTTLAGLVREDVSAGSLAQGGGNQLADTLATLEALNDAMDRAGSSASRAGAAVRDDLVPPVKDLGDEFEDAGAKMREFFIDFASGSLNVSSILGQLRRAALGQVFDRIIQPGLAAVFGGAGPSMSSAPPPRPAGLTLSAVLADRGSGVTSLAKAAAPQPQAVAVTVRVDGARGNREIEDTVTRGVRAGLEQYDRGLATRVRQISADPARVF